MLTVSYRITKQPIFRHPRSDGHKAQGRDPASSPMVDTYLREAMLSTTHQRHTKDTPKTRYGPATRSQGFRLMLDVPDHAKTSHGSIMRLDGVFGLA
jgi:hypothetical protein